jgi:ATP-dependent exoDNAse (exonuclease V) beta subunit
MNDFELTRVKWATDHRGLPQAYYKLKVPSVSTIINELIPDPEFDAFVQAVGKDRAEKIMIAAGYRGSAMHLFIENYIATLVKSKDPSEALRITQEESPKKLVLEGVPVEKIEEGRNLFYKFYYSEYSNMFADLVGIELKIYSPTLYYRGILDIFYKNRVFDYSVSDFKSSSTHIKTGSIKEYKYKTQLGAYANALDELYIKQGLIIKYASLICVNTKNDNIQVIECAGTELEKHKEIFKTLCIQYHKKNNQEYLLN